jgi:hypothetical protein
MSTMFHQLVTASLLLCFLAVSASCQQQLKGKQLDSVEHVRAISMSAEIAMTDSLRSIKESESVSMITLEEGLSGYGVDAVYSDNTTCTTFAAAMVYPLNACFYYSGSLGFTNAKITATSSKYTFQQFTDEQCTVESGSATTTSYSSTCGAKGQKYFLQPSQEVDSSQSVAYIR